jgi:hypothetical protein
LKMKKIRFFASVLAASVLLGAQAPTAVQASTYDYNLTLTALVGLESGSGSFSLNVPTGSTAGTLTENHGLTGSINIGGVTIGLDSTSSVSYLLQGSSLFLTGFFSGQAAVPGGVDTLVSLTFGSGGGYSFTDSANSKLNTIGAVSVSQTPLPTSLPLLASGLCIIAMLGWYRKRKAASYFAV